MDRMRVGRVAGVNRVAMASGPDAAHRIVSVTDDGSGNALFTTAGPHGLTGGESPLTVSGTSNAAYNVGTWAVDGVPSSTTWITAGSYQGDSTGGQWRL